MAYSMPAGGFMAWMNSLRLPRSMEKLNCSRKAPQKASVTPGIGSVVAIVWNMDLRTCSRISVRNASSSARFLSFSPSPEARSNNSNSTRRASK